MVDRSKMSIIKNSLSKIGKNVSGSLTKNVSKWLNLQPVPPALPTAFKTGGFLTLGAEVEVQLINKDTLNLENRAEELLRDGKHITGLRQELYKSTIEIVTDKCRTAHDVHADLKKSMDQLTAVADKLGISLASTGCHPFAKFLDCEIFPSKRYHEMIDRNQWLVRRMTVYGLHVHIGLRDGDECIRFNNFFMRFVPHLLALSASSPFWQGNDTGLAAHRPSTYEALPTAGMPYQVNSWTEFEQLYETLVKAEAIQSLKDLWWDVRPSPNFGTVEIRICDGPASLSEATAIVAFIHALAAWFTDHGNWLEQMARAPYWVARENKWRAMRYGMDARMVTDISGGVKPLRDDIFEWLDRLQPYIKQLGYENYIEDIRLICNRGSSSFRQQEVYLETNSLEDVVRHNVEEFKAQRPLYAAFVPSKDVKVLEMKQVS